MTLHCCEAVRLDYQGPGAVIPETISKATAERADRLVRNFIIPHAIHFYLDLVPEGTEIINARSIGGYILTKKLTRFTFGDLTTNVYCCRKQSKDTVRAMIEPLELLGWVVPEQRMNPTSWKVRPAVHAQFTQKAAEEEARRERVREAILEHAAGGR